MFVPPEQRRSWVPPPPDREESKRSDAVLPWLIGLFLCSMILAPIGSSTVVHAVLALLHRPGFGG